jgi:2-keto-4-pentenoate hydratase/2-oxohepta-3-ene-1,7-dioic acid hydratase in catechol pathway
VGIALFQKGSDKLLLRWKRIVKLVTRDEIVKKTGLVLPSDLEQFLFGKEYGRMVKANLTKLSFTHEITEFRLLPPIMKTFKIICSAFNYTDLVNWARFGKNPPKEPIIYMKPRTSLIGPIDDIVCPKFVKQLDYEGELAFVIDKKC